MATQCLDDVAIAAEPTGRSEQYLVGWRFGDWYLQQGGDPDGRPSELWSAEKASGFLDRLALGAETPKSGAAGGSAQAEPGRPDAEVSAFEVLTSAQGDTVWVNWADGSCIARFSKRFGIDVHASGEAQMAGAPQCLFCTHGAAGPAQWRTFQQKVREHHGIDVPNDAIAFAGE
ncbi:hypothetical protein SGO26_30000 (plasmid) [Cupriavidus metallidurans]|uniref:hypothetical protein n=1 Tax=Cupriavidus metallidurans TaxID=119219 RepID=UPI003D725BDC